MCSAPADPAGIEGILSLIGELYAAAINASVWEVALARLATAVAATSGFLDIYGAGGMRIEPVARIGFPADVGKDELYRLASSVWQQLQKQQPEAVVGHALPIEHHLVDARFDLLVCGAWLEAGPDTLALLSLHRDAARGDFTQDQRALIDAILPHLARALVIRARLKASIAGGRLELAALDALSFGVVIATASGHVLLANRFTERIAAEGDGLWLGTDERVLSAATHAVTAALRQLVETTARASPPARPSAISLPRPSGKQALVAVAMPMPRPQALAAADEPCAILIVHDPELPPTSMREVLRTGFGLTAAEARIAGGLAAGASIEDLAEFHGISIETVRSQLKSIFVKTDTRRQGELMALIARLDSARADSATTAEPPPEDPE